MSRCESRFASPATGAIYRCEGPSDHPYKHHGGSFTWTDEQADKPEGIDEVMRAVYAEALKGKKAAFIVADDPILTKTGKTREWWRYHYAGLVMQSNLSKGWAARRADCVLHADALLEELEK
jgi:hypothetical protein